MIYILYHSDCCDGFAAYCITRAALLQRVPPPQITGLALHYGTQETAKAALELKASLQEGDEVYVVDFSLPMADMEWLAERASKFLVIDHHKTACEKIPEGMPWAVLSRDNSASGALLAWRYWFPDHVAPWPVLAIDKRDRGLVWRTGSDRPADADDCFYLHAALMRGLVRTPEAWMEVLPGADPQLLKDMLAEGAVLHEAAMSLARAYVRNFVWVKVYGWRVPALDHCPRHLASDALNLLALEFPTKPYVLTWYVDADGLVTLSLRSLASGADCSEIAKTLDPDNGGGHARAAGCRIPCMLQIVAAGDE